VARRNAKLKELRGLVARDRAILAVDLASRKQAAVVLDHDSVVLARRMFTGSAWCISEILTWAEPVAAKAGFAGLVLVCEPTGHRWKPLVVTARAASIPVVCVQPLLVHRAREGEDFTRNRSDFDDAVIIGRLTSELRCYVPDLPEGPWARLRHLGARRAELLVRATAARQCLRDLLECAWPALLATAGAPGRDRGDERAGVRGRAGRAGAGRRPAACLPPGCLGHPRRRGPAGRDRRRAGRGAGARRVRLRRLDQRPCRDR
jgi:hypothetical protein